MPTLRETRIARLWSQDALAAESGVAKRTIAGIETGQRTPRLKTMRKLAGALGLPWEEVQEFREAVAGIAQASDTDEAEAGR